MNFQQFSSRARVPFGFLLGITYILFARPSAAMLPAGLVVAFVGLLIRGWAAGHIEKNSRLSTAGPYAYVRNPLYVGSFLLALGFAAVWTWWFLLLVIAFFVLIYTPTIRRESGAMASLFPNEYPAYAANVPPFLPRPTPWKPPTGTQEQGAGFKVSRYLRHAEWKAALGYLAGAAWLTIRLNLGL